MALPVKEQLKYWGVAGALFLAIFWFLGGALLPFILGMAIAYFLDPVADRLEDNGFSRVWATVTITLIALVVFALMALLVLPEISQQAIALVNSAPEILQNLQTFLNGRFPSLMDETSTLRQSLMQLGETIQSKGGALLEGIVTSAMSLLNVVALIVLVPVITFYLLLDWDRMVAEIDKLLPRDHAPVVRRLAGEIDKTLASFIRGQGTVCVILGTYYAVALMLAGLQFGLVVGFLAGLISFIPYVGALVGGALALGLAVFQFWGEWWMIGIIAAIFFAGQVLEGNVLTPNLVGGSVGLHPVWLIFALSAFGTMFGFVGMLIAVPVAAAIGVLARYGIGQYMDSRLYKGLAGDAEE
ncbi:AI-2E family transporter [Actibacterium lipolyticum]|uniref:Pheromone autoinducer 2 transporter n=1 Tax=Actibacterium lipolyticum TaxID=1524263 RepID=A0A238JQA3_9RHOB|nr:AI-2E family transporter [Actibacterium lipolyticum]SMX32725.1 pheromone autoinducer 2 transporter [Actibacterium lipolyticum]